MLREHFLSKTLGLCTANANLLQRYCRVRRSIAHSRFTIDQRGRALARRTLYFSARRS